MASFIRSNRRLAANRNKNKLMQELIDLNFKRSFKVKLTMAETLRIAELYKILYNVDIKTTSSFGMVPLPVNSWEVADPKIESETVTLTPKVLVAKINNNGINFIIR